MRHRQRLRVQPQPRLPQLLRTGTGTDVATAQVSAGLAWVYVPYARQHPQLLALQRQAKASRTGLWSQSRPLAPWTYRQRYGTSYQKR